MTPDEPQKTAIDTRLALIGQDVSYMREEMRDLKVRVGSSFVTKDEFTPVKEKVDSVLKALIWVVSILVGALILAVVNQLIAK